MKPALGTIVCAVVLAGCGSTTTQSTTTAPAAPPPPVTTTSKTASGPSGLQAEATAAAQGDIPDNQMFLTFTNAHAGYAMKYPEGWAQSGRASNVTIRDKNNIVRVEVVPGKLPSYAQAKRDLGGTRIVSGPTTITIGGKPAIRVVYTTRSAPNPVTGKRVTLVTDRYYLSSGSKEAIVDLGTPQGVDNVDAYRLMIESFKWK
jgi:hypothetical protein